MDEAKLESMAERVASALIRIRDNSKEHPEVLEHFAYVLERISDCYDSDKRSYGVLVVREDEVLRLLSIRCDVEDVLSTLDEARKLVHFDVCADAPPKEMFN